MPLKCSFVRQTHPPFGGTALLFSLFTVCLSDGSLPIGGATPRPLYCHVYFWFLSGIVVVFDLETVYGRENRISMPVFAPRLGYRNAAMHLLQWQNGNRSHLLIDEFGNSKRGWQATVLFSWKKKILQQTKRTVQLVKLAYKKVRF